MDQYRRAAASFATSAPSVTALPSVTLRTLTGDALAPWIEDLARLRIAVFRDWPYLYQGDAAYEAAYLRSYLGAWRSVVVLALDGGRVVGASTGLPLADEPAEFRAPFEKAGLDVDPLFYFGESVLLPAYRGRGLGHRFFDERESHARALGGFTATVFCAVDRATDDPRRPPFGRDNGPFWRKRGYRPREDVKVSMAWTEVGGQQAANTLTPWFRPLERAR